MVCWLEVLLIFAIIFIVGGAPPPHVNETYYLTKAKHYWEPQWCAGDPFLESADAHLTFYWTIGWLAKWFSLPVVAWIGRIAAWMLLAVSWQRLSSRVLHRPLFGVLSCMLMATLIEKTYLSGEWVFGGVEGKCFAYAFVFWGLAELAEGRWRRMWLWLGLAGAFHVLVGGWATIAAGFVWMTERRVQRASLVSLLPTLFLGGVLALPGVIPALQLTRGVSAETAAEANQIYVFERLAHHLAPLALPAQELTKKGLRFSLVVVGLGGLWWLTRKREEEGAEGLNRLLRFAWGSLVLCLVGFSWELAAWNQPALAAKLLKYYWFRLADVAVPLAMSLAVFWLASGLMQRRPKLAGLFLLTTLAYPCWFMLSSSSARYQNPLPPADRKVTDHHDWQQACRWARENTPADALFLVPRGSQSFEWYAYRKGLVTWKDVPQDAASLISWRDRYFDVFTRIDEQEHRTHVSFAKQGDERVGQLAEKYQAEYVITDEYPPLLLPRVYQNKSFTIYATNLKAKSDSQ